MKDKKENRRKNRPSNFYHASPYKLKCGSNIKPRWSPFNLEYRVWMSSNLQSAIESAKEIIDEIKLGGTIFLARLTDELWEPREIHGVWVYQVKPTGPAENYGRGTWITSFPVRVLKIIHTYGEPSKNKLASAPRRSEEGVVRLMMDDFNKKNSSKIVAAYNKSYSLNDFDKIIRKALIIYEKRDVRELYNVLCKCKQNKISEAVAAWCLRKVEEEALKLKKKRRDQHHKLIPDPKYQRKKKRIRPVDIDD